MLIAAIILRICHIFVAITWFGGTMYRSLILLPSLAALPPAEQRGMLRQVQERHETLLLMAGFLVIILGIMLGTIVGPIQQGSVLLTDYGLTWITCMVLAATLLIWEGFVVSPLLTNAATEPEVAVSVAAEERPPLTSRLQWLAGSELVVFVLILTGMVLLHFDL